MAFQYFMHRDPYPEDCAKVEISRVCQYIKDHIQTDISLNLCSELIGMSPSYMSRLFKKEMEMSYVEYVMISKMEEAKRLLLETGQNVNDIAVLIGYSERNLNRIFQRYLKQTPGRYRSDNLRRYMEGESLMEKSTGNSISTM